ncbi:MAG: peptide deformylase [Alphaproteobacteria bacterium]|nr:peptide deformylase [Alphaproteobacteria bacterium]
MAIRDIARMGHPALGRPAEEVADPKDPAIVELVSDMIETMHAAGGVGLAAPQIAVPKRVLVFELPVAEEVEGARERALTVLINPVIEPVGTEMEEGWEGCLSLPGMAGLVPRHAKVRYRGVTPAGEAIAREASGFHARVVQHEADHLDGILYPMRIKDLAHFGYVDEMEKKHPEL